MKKHLSLLTFILTALFLISPNVLYGADIWSEPTYTDQWSEPTYTEQWSSSETTEIWTGPSTYIRLQIGSNSALVKDKDIKLDVSPIVVEGRTMVPIRFVGENLNASVGWDQKTQQATLTLNDKIIILTIGKSTAMVNGKQVELDVPAMIKDGRTLVPLRFVSENLDLFVNYIAQTKTIEISDQPTNLWAGETTEPIDENLLDFEKLYGTWYIWTPGSATNLYDKTTGDYVTHEYNMGADQGKVTINKDGTYSMTHAAWAKDKTVQGKWRLSYPAEINGERIQAIVLINGVTDVNWAVAPSANGKIRLLYAMEWGNGSATWVFDSELYKK